MYFHVYAVCCYNINIFTLNLYNNKHKYLQCKFTMVNIQMILFPAWEKSVKKKAFCLVTLCNVFVSCKFLMNNPLRIGYLKKIVSLSF